MTRTGWLLTVLTSAIVVALFAWLMRTIEWVDADVSYPPRGEAARDRFYVAKQLASRLGATVTTVHDFGRLPPVGATLLLGSHRWSMFAGREAALRRWIEQGGHVVALQSAWSGDGDTPRWVPIRTAHLPRRDAAKGAAPPASATLPPDSGGTPAEIIAAMLARPAAPCGDFVEPDWIDSAFGTPRRYRVCGTPIRVLRPDAPSWLLAGRDGAVAARVAYGRGEITANAIEGSFDNAALVRDDGALAFAAMLQLRPGATVWFFDDETRAGLLSVVWENGAAALLLAAAAIALLLWRGGTRFGPLVTDPPPARRSIGEQVRRTAAFIARGDGTALHRASVRALENEARRSLPGYALLVGTRERCEAIARAGRRDATALAAAMTLPAGTDRHRLAAAIVALESARRALLRNRHRAVQPSLPADPSPP